MGRRTALTTTPSTGGPEIGRVQQDHGSEGPPDPHLAARPVCRPGAPAHMFCAHVRCESGCECSAARTQNTEKPSSICRKREADNWCAWPVAPRASPEGLSVAASHAGRHAHKGAHDARVATPTGCARPSAAARVGAPAPPGLRPPEATGGSRAAIEGRRWPCRPGPAGFRRPRRAWPRLRAAGRCGCAMPHGAQPIAADGTETRARVSA